MAKKYEELDFTDDFMFCKVLTNNPELCRGLHKYTFTNRCEELPELLLGDEAAKIFLCADGKADDVSEEMKEFLQWMVTGHLGNSNLVKSLDNAVQKARDHEKWRLEYMTLLMRDNQMREEGRVEGRIEVYRNLRKRGFSKKEAADLAEIPESVVEQEEKESE